MITFPLDSGAALIVIEPGNIARLKEGRPLKVRLPGGAQALVCFTPDTSAFLKCLGIREPEVAKGQRIEVQTELSADQIANALRICQGLPEVQR